MERTVLPERLDRKTLYESDYVCLYADKVRMSDGRIIEKYHQIHYPNESVAIIVVNENDEILLIQNKRYTLERLEWEIPAGSIEKKETKEDAARRECIEETGCLLKNLEFLFSQNPSNGMADLLCHYFIAKVDSETAIFDTNEVMNKRWMTKADVLDMLRNNETKCGVTMLGLLYALQFCFS